MTDTNQCAIEINDSWGIGNLRPAAGYPMGQREKFRYVCAVGPMIVVWDVKKKQRIVDKQYFNDLITILLRSRKGNLILAVSYSGQGILLNQSFEPVSYFTVPGNNVVYASWSSIGTQFTICTIGYDSSISVFEVKEKNATCVILKWRKQARDIKRVSDSNSANDTLLHTIENNKTNTKSKDAEFDDSEVNYEKQTKILKQNPLDSYYGCIFTEDDNIMAIFKHDKKPSEAHLFSLQGELLLKNPISPLGESNTSMMCISECRHGLCAIGLQRGLFVFLDSKSLELSSIFQAQGSAQICIWDNDLLLTAAYQSGVLQWWNCSGELIKELHISKIDSVVHLNWSDPGKELWIGGITSLNYIFIESSEQEEAAMFSLSAHQVAGCGLAFQDPLILASGDLAGNILINETGKTLFSVDTKRSKLNNSVRCMIWVQDTLFIGTLEGLLFVWQLKDLEVDNAIKLVYTFPFSVLTMKVANRRAQLAIGTGGGDLFIFDATEGSCKLVLEIHAHEYKIVAKGMEKQPMEIWSVAWQPNDAMVATASEDQTSLIFDAFDGGTVAKITGHSTAVTSVDWKVLNDERWVFATCADDRTVRLNDGKTYELLHVLKTDAINGWYTFTYLAINPLNNTVVVSSQNGFIVLWDLNSLNCAFCRKLHCGSIEGLEWNSTYQCFATIGSDCVVNVSSFLT